MEIIIGIFYFLLGISVGSFLNVVILRHGEKSISGRSFCTSCKKTLSWYEIIPLISFLLLKGKCSSCDNKISSQYPLVELGTGLLFLAVFIKFVPVINTFYILFSIYYLVILSLLVIIFVYDLYHKIIPNIFSYPFSALAFLSIFNLEFGILDLERVWSVVSVWDIFAGPITAFPFAFLWLISRGTWMGLGDAKLALGIGWLLGILGGITAVMLSFWIGAVISILLLLLQKKKLSEDGKQLTIKSEIPFAPFLIVGLLLTFFLDIDIISFLIL